MRRVSACALGGVLLLCLAPAAALAHPAFVGSAPAPGARVARPPQSIAMTFSEPLEGRFSHASLVRVKDGAPLPVRVRVDRRRLTLLPAAPLPRGAYRVEWHVVSGADGHPLEGRLSFGLRAAAAGGRAEVQQSPLAGGDWVRVLARGLLYGTLLLFAGALMLELLLGGRPPWPAPSALAAAVGVEALDRVERRHRRVVLDSGLLAAAAAVLAAVTDAAGAGGLSAQGAADFLLTSDPGRARLYVVLFVVLAVAGARARLRVAALPALLALGAVALSGHAAAASPRAVAVIADWIHLAAAAVWLGGIVVLALVWGASLRRRPPEVRTALARTVLARFARVALPAFAVVVATGLVSALIELGHPSALWQTGYGRVLLVKIVLVAAIAVVSRPRAFRLRPRLPAAQPALALGAVVAVALLVAFPLPPRQLPAAAQAQTQAACARCPLPRPAPGELAVAGRGGSDVVAAWIRRSGGAVAGTVRLYGLDGRPAGERPRVQGASQRDCGPACVRFRLRGTPAAMRVALVQKGRRYVARLPVRWRRGGSARARALLARAQATMRRVRQVRESERVSSVPGLSATTRYALAAPDRMRYRTDRGVRSVVIGGEEWTRGETGDTWRKGRFGGGLPFRTRSWFTWTTYARSAYLLREWRAGGRRRAELALMDAGTPAWWRLTIDVETRRVLRTRLVAYGHFMTQRFFAFDRPLEIRPPRGAA